MDQVDQGQDVTSKFLVLVLAIAAGATVANLYYCQPLLAIMAKVFHRNSSSIGWVPTLTQLGYAMGLILLVPLGDSHERRKLIVRMTLLVALSLLAVAYSPSFAWLLGASFFLGLATIVPQLVVPFAASLAAPQKRGPLVGKVMSGLLIGIILSRSISGYAASYLNWREIYVLASAMMLGLALVVHVALSKQYPPAPVPYRKLLGTLGHLARTEPVLRRRSLVGACSFGAFSIFWTPLIFHLHSISMSYGAHTVGLLGLLGVTGALVAPLSGHMSERFGIKWINGIALLITVTAFATLWAGGKSLAIIALGTILLDAGVQGSHISNQTRIYSLHPELRNRLNAVYMFTYFIGGAIGSVLGTFFWQTWGWNGVCLLGGGFGLLGFATHISE